MEKVISFKSKFGWINAKERNNLLISISFGKLKLHLIDLEKLINKNNAIGVKKLLNKLLKSYRSNSQCY